MHADAARTSLLKLLMNLPEFGYLEHNLLEVLERDNLRINLAKLTQFEEFDSADFLAVTREVVEQLAVHLRLLRRQAFQCIATLLSHFDTLTARLLLQQESGLTLIHGRASTILFNSLCNVVSLRRTNSFCARML